VATIDIKKLFGESVKRLRSSLGISQEVLAERADLHRTYISDVERGTRNLSLESITRLAAALEVAVPVLFPAIGELGDLSHAAAGMSLVEVLLVEDNPDDVELTRHFFGQARFANHIHVAADGQEALDYLFCQGVHVKRSGEAMPLLILLDLLLPKINGLEVLRQIKADKRTRDIPVIVLTTSHVFDDFKECDRLGAADYIMKPLDFKKLSQITPRLKLDWALVKPEPARLGSASL
jgi:CheY-like chemotaxis protein/DNA-binding XRE family transcriptional regulator